jgi:hypothetical protein
MIDKLWYRKDISHHIDPPILAVFQSFDADMRSTNNALITLASYTSQSLSVKYTKHVS